MRAYDIPAPFRIPARFALGWPAPKNKLLGMEFAGQVEAVGEGATSYKAGDRVYGIEGGCYCEYRISKETGAVAHIPDGLGFAEAASLPFGTTTAMHFLQAAGLTSGQSILIIGASGCVGVYSVQLAKHMGAVVTAVCSARNAELVTSLGADRVIDYATTDYLASGGYDVVMDCVGATTFRGALRSLKRGGVFLNIVLGMSDLLSVMSPFKSGRKIVSGSFNVTRATMLALNDLVANDAFAPVIDRSYTLDQIQQAHAYADTKRKRGSVVVTV